MKIEFNEKTKATIYPTLLERENSLLFVSNLQVAVAEILVAAIDHLYVKLNVDKEKAASIILQLVEQELDTFFSKEAPREEEKRLYANMVSFYQEWANGREFDEDAFLSKKHEQFQLNFTKNDKAVTIFLESASDERIILSEIEINDAFFEESAVQAYLVACILFDKLYGEKQNPLRSNQPSLQEFTYHLLKTVKKE